MDTLTGHTAHSAAPHQAAPPTGPPLEAGAAPSGEPVETAPIDAEAAYRAATDPVTGLASRAYMVATLDALVSTDPGDASLLLVELDGMRWIDDRIGPRAGDTVLVEAGRRIVRAAGIWSVVGRVDRDRFAVLSQLSIGCLTGEQVRRRIERSLSPGIHVASHHLVVRASVVARPVSTLDRDIAHILGASPA